MQSTITTSINNYILYSTVPVQIIISVTKPIAVIVAGIPSLKW